MRQHVKRVTPCAMVLVALGIVAWADVVVLDDGRKIEGLIVSETTRDVTLKLDTGAVVNFPRNRVRSVSKADWQYYVQKGDNAATGADALEFYQRAKKMNPDAPGLDEKIALAESRVREEAKQKISEQERARRLADENQICERYQTLMDAVRPDAARELLEKAIAEKPWLCRPRILLAEQYARERAPDKRVRHLAALAGLIRNDPAAYYDSYARTLVEAAERALLDASTADVMSSEQKDRAIAYAASLVGEDGRVLSLSEFEARQREKVTSDSITLRKVEFLKNVCLKRAGGDIGIEREIVVLVDYANGLSAAGKQSALRPRLDQWAKQAGEFLDGKELDKGTILADIILQLDSQHSGGQAAAVKAAVLTARRFRERNQFDKARKTIEAAERIVPNNPQIAGEKAQLSVATAQSFSNAGNWTEAVNAMAAAVAARPSDAETARLVRAEQDRLFQTLMVRAELRARQKDPAGAMDTVNLALQVKSDLKTKFTAQSTVRGYRRQLGDLIREQIKGAADRQDVDAIVAAVGTAVSRGMLDERVTSTIMGVINTLKQQAEMADAKGDVVGAYIAGNRCERLSVGLPADPKLQALAKKAGEAAVGGGKLTVQNFFAGMWVGQEIQWVLSETEIHFNGKGFRAEAINLAAGSSVIAEHGSGPQYTIRVDRGEARDVIVVRVLHADSMVIESYASTPTDASRTPTMTTYNVALKRVPPPKPGTPGGSTSGGGSSGS